MTPKHTSPVTGQGTQRMLARARSWMATHGIPEVRFQFTQPSSTIAGQWAGEPDDIETFLTDAQALGVTAFSILELRLDDESIEEFGRIEPHLELPEERLEFTRAYDTAITRAGEIVGAQITGLCPSPPLLLTIVIGEPWYETLLGLLAIYEGADGWNPNEDDDDSIIPGLQ